MWMWQPTWPNHVLCGDHSVVVWAMYRAVANSTKMVHDSPQHYSSQEMTDSITNRLRKSSTSEQLCILLWQSSFLVLRTHDQVPWATTGMGCSTGV